MSGPGLEARPLVKLVGAVAVLLLCTVALADWYEVDQRLVDSEKVRGLLRTAFEFENDTTRVLGYEWSTGKERCYEWNVGLSVLRKFNLGSSQSGCESTGSYSTMGRLDPGQWVRVYAQAWTEYRTHLAQRIRIDDATLEQTVVDSVYATQERHYEQYWRVVR